ncbi:unnamed protein product [Brassica napus]|uniref:(rape) hypothetical protein n=1 Tax=Brassica napus TaxID=3708 RepID=A0A816V7T7_BRANA|nr:unnamed protein product [Brassica napus]
MKQTSFSDVNITKPDVRIAFGHYGAKSFSHGHTSSWLKNSLTKRLQRVLPLWSSASNRNKAN